TAAGDAAGGPDRPRGGVLPPVDERLPGGAPNAFGSGLAALPTLFLQGGVEGLPRRGQVWPQLERPAEAGDGAVQVALLAEAVAQVEVGLSVLRVERDGLAVAGDGLVQLALVRQRIAQVGVGRGVVRVQFDGLAVAGDGAVQVALPA